MMMPREIVHLTFHLFEFHGFRFLAAMLLGSALFVEFVHRRSRPLVRAVGSSHHSPLGDIGADVGVGAGGEIPQLGEGGEATVGANNSEGTADERLHGPHRRGGRNWADCCGGDHEEHGACLLACMPACQ
jgi:hypothetical protein